ncbi:ADP-ribosylglycohydrolase family protein [Kibdelosporangium philippinense]|uniref:ADP-ribosylglycohydrolase family protein n=1 Tax=Kibdelosporangium philippinense TaxID=211113 RepID=UPI003557065B
MGTQSGQQPCAGMTCLRACGGLAEGEPWVDATITGSKGCGANMRVTPVGLLPEVDLDTLAGVSVNPLRSWRRFMPLRF